MIIGVIGSGTAGLVAATILKKYTSNEVFVVSSSNIGIIGVGESTTEHINEYLQFMQIPIEELVEETGAIPKKGVNFKGWSVSNPDFIFSIKTSHTSTVAQYPYVYGYSANEQKSKGIELKKGEVCNQYHFNSYKLNKFLRKKALEVGVVLLEDKIVEVCTSGNSISKVKGAQKSYKADFFVDATGFRRALINKVGGKWNSYSPYLKVNSAVVTFKPSTWNYANKEAVTTASVEDAGWMWDVPNEHGVGIGYVYSDKYATDEEALERLRKVSAVVEDSNYSVFKFNPGCLEDTWIGNCCAIGLSASFIEPLEASAIGTSIQQSFLLLNTLPNYTPATIKQYNKICNSMHLNIRDFVFLHYYRTRGKGTPFWDYVSNINPPATLKHKLELWEKNLPREEDFIGDTGYKLFGPFHYADYILKTGKLYGSGNVVDKELHYYNNVVLYQGAKKAND